MIFALYIMLGLVSVLVIMEVVYLLTLLFKERSESPDSPMIVNFMSHRSNGRAIGVQTNSRQVANRHIIEFAPRDVDMLKLDKKVIDNEKIIVNDYMQVSLPKGILSKDKNVKFLLPINAEDLPFNLKQHPFGAALMQYIKMQTLSSTESDVLQEIIKRQKHIMKEHGGGEVSEHHIEMLDSLMSDFLKMTTKQKEQNKFEINRS